MAVTAKKSQSSIYDYPEHLNPFHEDDNHSKLRFWTMGRKKGRSNSFSFSSLKDFRNTLTLRSFRKKDRSTLGAPKSCISAQNSPVEYRKSFHVNSTVSPEMSRNRSTSQPQFDVLCTPLPRSRFHERISHLNTTTPEVETPTNKSDRVSLSNPTSHRDGQAYPLPGLTEKRSDMGSSSSLQSNPFDETAHSPIRASARKKRRAPLPPISSNVTPLPPVPNITITDTSVVQHTDDTTISVRKKLFEETVTEKDEIDIEDPSFKMELKIIEDDDEDDIQIKDAELNEKNTSDQHIAKIEVELNETNTSDQHIEKIDEELKIVKKLINETRVETTHVIDDNESKIDEEIPKDIQKDEINGIIEEKNDDTIDMLENSDDLFKKVDIITYKKQQSHKNHSDVHENKYEKQIAALDNNNLTGNKVEHKTNTNDWEMSEFSEFDKVIQDIENTAIAFIDEDDIKPEETKGNRVSQLKFQFENVNIKDDDAYEIKTNSPNPIPKPRRAKLFSKSTSSDSSKVASPSSPDS